jgi:two-component system, NarL family, sensor kinase
MSLSDATLPAFAANASSRHAAESAPQTHAPADRGAVARRARRRTWRSPTAVLVLSAFVAAAMTGLVSVGVLQRTGRHEAERGARALTRIAGEGVVAPWVTPALLSGDPAAVARLDRIVRRHVLRGPVVRVKLWAPRGRVVYSDEPRLIGRRFRLRSDDWRVLRTGRGSADVSDLTQPENRFERAFHTPLLQVYQRLHATDGRSVLFEVYLRDAAVSARGRRLWQAFLPALIIGLVTLQLANIPLARSFARRLQRAERERGDVLQRALAASDRARRTIATNLHDGVVQDLAAAAFGLDAALATIGPSADPSAIRDIVEARDLTREGIRSLRLELVDIYPPDLLRTGLRQSLDDLMSMARRSGLRAELVLPEDLQQSAATQGVLYRAAQEAVRNVIKHAEARTVRVAFHADVTHAAVEIRDDGNGLGGRATAPDTHFGLRTLRDLLEDAGGILTVRGVPGHGTTLRAELPAA